jgi:hypothetical protein
MVASSPNPAARTRPSVNPPWRLAHSTINGSSQRLGLRLCSDARARKAVQTTMIGKVSRWGRARK